VLEVTVTRELRSPCCAIFVFRLFQSHKLEGFTFHKSNCNNYMNQIKSLYTINNYILIFNCLTPLLVGLFEYVLYGPFLAASSLLASKAP
jgi:hypothetical protein